jgi:hypothetical protein
MAEEGGANPYLQMQMMEEQQVGLFGLILDAI